MLRKPGSGEKLSGESTTYGESLRGAEVAFSKGEGRAVRRVVAGGRAGKELVSRRSTGASRSGDELEAMAKGVGEIDGSLTIRR